MVARKSRPTQPCAQRTPGVIDSAHPRSPSVEYQPIERIAAVSGAAHASGVPEQVSRTASERLLVPLIHFVLLGFLPIRRMRIDLHPALGAGCGQLFVAFRHAYVASGGHRAIRRTLHDGPKLPRVFRSAGFRTDLFDATDIASCRMFSTGAEVWRGLARNAGEGLGSPRLIGRYFLSVARSFRSFPSPPPA